MDVPLYCISCGNRALVELNEFDEKALKRVSYVQRFCRRCHTNTRWEPALAAAAETKPVESSGAAEPARILLIDDDESVLEILKRALARESFDIETATSARDALMRLARSEYDLILSDIRMPEFDGKALFEFVERNLPEYKSRVVFLTGDTGSRATIEFLKQHKPLYLTKPIDIQELLEVIRRLIPAKEG